jgi:hypothetical protein
MSAYQACPEICGHLQQPGLAHGEAKYIDHADLDTSVDQLAIEEALQGLPWRGRTLLHVGTGNSRLAQRFAGELRLIDGLTVCEREIDRARALGIPNYTVHFLNKYGRDFLVHLRNRYDFVIDNNMASFACCRYHFYRLLDNYLGVLQPGGRILTDQRGMDWTVHDPRWRLTYQDLCDLGQTFPLTVSRVAETVYALQSTET